MQSEFSPESEAFVLLDDRPPNKAGTRLSRMVTAADAARLKRRSPFEPYGNGGASSDNSGHGDSILDRGFNPGILIF